MPSDPLDKYRPAASSRVSVESVEGQPYAALELSENAQRRFIRFSPVGKANHSFQYGHLVKITDAGGVILGLSFAVPRAVVEIKGENLEPLLTAILDGRAATLTEFIPGWHKQVSASEPFIETMTITEAGQPASEPDPAQDVKLRH